MNKQVYILLYQVTLVVSDSATLWTIAYEASLLGFSKQEYWSGLPCLSLGDLLDPGIEPTSLMFLVLAGGFFITRVTWDIPCTPFYTHTNGCRKKHIACCVVC